MFSFPGVCSGFQVVLGTVQGVLSVLGRVRGSGRYFFASGAKKQRGAQLARSFGDWLEDTVTSNALSREERTSRLAQSAEGRSHVQFAKAVCQSIGVYRARLLPGYRCYFTTRVHM